MHCSLRSHLLQLAGIQLCTTQPQATINTTQLPIILRVMLWFCIWWVWQPPQVTVAKWSKIMEVYRNPPIKDVIILGDHYYMDGGHTQFLCLNWKLLQLLGGWRGFGRQPASIQLNSSFSSTQCLNTKITMWLKLDSRPRSPEVIEKELVLKFHEDFVGVHLQRHVN